MSYFLPQIHKEDVRDLLDLVSSMPSSGKAPTAPPVPSGKAPITIRETSDGGIALAGVTEIDVRSVSEMAACLEQGSLCRATGSTSMNSHSRCGFVKVHFSYTTSDYVAVKALNAVFSFLSEYAGN